VHYERELIDNSGPYPKYKEWIHLWDDGEKNGGTPYYKKIPYERYAYKFDEKGPFRTINGFPVKKVHRWSREDEESGMIFESDVKPEMRFLVDNYTDSEIPSKAHRELFIDIETDSSRGFSTGMDAKYPVTAIAFYSKFHNRYVVLLLDVNGEIGNFNAEIKGVQAEIKSFQSEAELLENFLYEWINISPTIVTGWNCISENERLWTKDGIIELKNSTVGQNLNEYGNIIKKVNTGIKDEFKIILDNNSEILCSDNHIFPFYIKGKEKYKNKNTLLTCRRDEKVKNVIDLMSENDLFIKLNKHNNENDDYTYKNFILDNFDYLKDCDNFNFVLSDKSFFYKMKKNNVIKNGEYPSTFCKRRSNFWSYKNLKNYFTKDEIIEFILNNDKINFIFKKKSVEIDISEKISNDDLYLLGLIYTDGWFSKKYDKIGISNSNTDVILESMRICNKYRNHKYIDIKQTETKRESDPCMYTYMSVNNKFSLLFHFIYDKKINKNINVYPISKLSYSQFMSFISGFIDGDGCVRPDGTVAFCNYNNNDIIKLQELLLWNGVYSSRCENDVYIIKSTYSKTFYENLTIKHSKKMERLNEFFIDKNYCISKDISYFEYDNFVLCKVKSILNTGNKSNMYDLTTESHLFCCNGMETHNCDDFDIPYLYNRLSKVLGKEYAKQLSPIGIVTYNKHRRRFFIAGVSCLDYMLMYKTFTFGQRVSYSLEAISQFELGHGKIKYKGTLDRLFKEDKQKFIEYNLNDVILVVEIDGKMRFIDLARTLSHKGHIPFEDVFFSSRHLDGAILTYIKNKGLVAINKPPRVDSDDETLYADSKDNDEDDEETFKGAYVKEPIPGIYRWVVDLDLQSLYPSIMRTLNISPETKMMKIKNFEEIVEQFGVKYD
jgi:hypothetical protein